MKALILPAFAAVLCLLPAASLAEQKFKPGVTVIKHSKVKVVKVKHEKPRMKHKGVHA